MSSSLFERLALVLQNYPAPCRPIGPFNPLGNAGGLSGANLVAFDATCGRLVMRIWPPGIQPRRLDRIHQWVLAFGDRLAVAAVPMRTRSSNTFVELSGRLYQLEPWKPGKAIGESPASTACRAVSASLACLHQELSTERTFQPSPGLEHRLKALVKLKDGELDELSSALEPRCGEPVTQLAREWVTYARRSLGIVLSNLSGTVPNARLLQPCLRDCRADHWLFQNDELTGLIDFGAMDVDSVAFDLARLRLDWWPDSCANAEQLIQAYEESTRLDDSNRALIPVIEQTTAVLAGANWVRWGFVEQKEFEARDAVEAGLSRSLRWMRSRIPGI